MTRPVAGCGASVTTLSPGRHRSLGAGGDQGCFHAVDAVETADAVDMLYGPVVMPTKAASASVAKAAGSGDGAAVR
ncbi:hypothetical protein [Streptomyces glaucescens]|uniref:hypothetical protein n=1 Tax=Streptomyces glaucescens TaxID=1907 RepID=UPI00131B3FB0|nr:hypothetical protein [Streptomyces glaucescens]